jgi:glucose-6-phosphate 1-dehydrogenase
MPSATPCALVIFGASGDLAKLKLVPAIYELAHEKLLPEKFALIGYGRKHISDEEFRGMCNDAIQKNSRSKKKEGKVDEAILKRLLDATYFCSGGYGDVPSFENLKSKLEQCDSKHGTAGNRLFYMSTPPDAFVPIVQGLGATKLAVRGASASSGQWQRVIIEKPFGKCLKEAQELNGLLLKDLREEQIYRIDHYLGKETVQNLMVMRFANSIFEPIWNYKYIDHVQITVAETVNADDRAGYYDKSGALRDMVQNHIFQIMALVAMEPPYALDAQSVRDEKVKVYKSIRPIRASQADQFAVRGQYGPGTYNDGKITTNGYLKAKDIPPTSRTETFAALKIFIDNWRWSGTPFYIRTGKALPQKISEVVVRFRSPPQTLFQKQCETPVFPNDLIIHVAPEEGLSMRLNGKEPGGTLAIRSVGLDFFYNQTFKKEAPEAYERLIFDAMLGDQTLFIRGDEAEAAWSVIDPIEQGWAQSKQAPQEYAPGSWGPRKAMDLIELDGRRWMYSGDDEAQPIIACSL